MRCLFGHRWTTVRIMAHIDHPDCDFWLTVCKRCHKIDAIQSQIDLGDEE